MFVSCSDLFGDFDVVGLEVFSTAFEKKNSGFGVSLRIFRIALVWVCVLLFGSGRFLFPF